MARASVVYDAVLQDRSALGRRGFLNSLDTIDNRAAALAVGGFAALSVGGVAAFTALYNSTAPLIDELGKVSESTGIGVVKLQAMADAAERAGVSQDALNGSLKEGLKRISEATQGSGDAGKMLDKVGLSAMELSRLAPEEQITKIFEAMEKLDNVNDRLQFADKVFGGQGIDLIRLTAGAINEAEQEMRDLDLALTEVNVGNVELLNDQLQKIGRFTSQSAKVFVAEMAPAISAVLSETIALNGSMLSARSTSQLLADSLIGLTGGFGDGINGLSNSYGYLKVVLADLNVKANEFTYNNDPNEQTLRVLQESRAEAQRLDDQLAGQTGAEDYSDRLRNAYEMQAEAAKEQLANQQLLADERQKLTNSFGNSTFGDIDSAAKAAEEEAKEAEQAAKKLAREQEREATAEERRVEREIQREESDLERIARFGLNKRELLLADQEQTMEALDAITARDISRTDEVYAIKQAANQEYHDQYLQIIAQSNSRKSKLDEQREASARSYLEQGIAHFAAKSEGADALHKALVARRMFREGREAVIGAYKWGNSIGGPFVGGVFAGIAGAYTAALIAETVGGGGGSAPAAPAVGAINDNPTTFGTVTSDARSQAANQPLQSVVVNYFALPGQSTAQADSEARRRFDEDVRNKRINIEGNPDVQVNVFDYEEYGT